ncbi:MAG: hypothetical protein HQK87_11610, partial [Nitrospinae bacterium]|nr:hypothetical protein [Nitrospinota bacterium]
MTRRLFVLYTADPDRALTDRIGPDDVVLTDHVISLPGRRIDLAAEVIDDVALIDALREVADRVSIGDGAFPRAFINNLYTCSVTPLFRLIAALKRILAEGPVAEVVFEAGATGPFISTYYMAEHE